jgi:hypothetical protein
MEWLKMKTLSSSPSTGKKKKKTHMWKKSIFTKIAKFFPKENKHKKKRGVFSHFCKSVMPSFLEDCWLPRPSASAPCLL